jgi:hypothetical protein
MNRVFSSGRKRLRIYLNQDKEQDFQEWKEQAADLSECEGTGCSGVEGKGWGSIPVPRNSVFRCGRKRLRIYLNQDKE